MKLFLQKNAKFSSSGGGAEPELRLQTPRTSGILGLCPQTPIGLR